MLLWYSCFFFFSSRRRHTRFSRDWSSDVCSSDLVEVRHARGAGREVREYDVVGSEYLASVSDGREVRGLRGEYYANTRLEGEPAIVRVDERLDFRCTFNPPGRGIARDWYSVRWTG